MEAEADHPHVEFREVSKSYDGTALAVSGVSFSVERGEFLSLLGPSGSGKTTCLSMLAGFEEVTDGDIRLGGRSLRGMPPRKRGIGMVFQNYALFPHMTVAANLEFPLEVRGVSRTERCDRVGRVLDLVRLAKMEDRRPAELSGGQQQRVAIARALVFEPDLVLMDEPLGALDRRLREELQYEIRRIHRTLGVTVVYVTHDQGEAMVMSDRIAVMKDGGIQQVAAPETLYEEPDTAFVARFVGENNTFRGRVERVDGTLCDVALHGRGDGRLHKVSAMRIADLSPGDETTLSIRPERMAIAPEAGLYRNEFDAEIEDITFLGDHLRIRLAVFGGACIAKIPNQLGQGRVLGGDRVRIGWTAVDCRALDAD